MKLKKRVKVLTNRLDIMERATVKLIHESKKQDETNRIMQAIMVFIGKRAGIGERDFMTLVDDAMTTVKEIEVAFETEEEMAAFIATKLEELKSQLERENADVH